MKYQANPYLHESHHIHKFSTVATSIIHCYAGQNTQGNVVLSNTAQTKHMDYVNDTYTFDEDSYPYVVDTGTTFHICKYRELFTGSLTKAQSIHIKGVGGRIKVCGHGTIKIRIIDDKNDDCNLIINNVLYIPESNYS